MDVALIGDTIDEILSRIPDPATGLSKADIQRLEELLKGIQDVVRREEQNDIHSEDDVLVWLRELKNVVNDLTDLVEELTLSNSINSSTTQQQNKLSNFLKHGKIKNRSKVNNNQKVNKIIEDLQFVATNYKLARKKESRKKETKITNWDLKIRRSELETVGRKKEKKEIIDQLIFPKTITNDVVSLPVVTIVGIAGIGTTKLARLIFDDEKVKAHFGSRIWLEKNETKDVVESVQKHVNNHLPTSYEKGYLVVIDDLKSEISAPDFLKLQDVFVTRGTSGAILVTTRSKVVANKITANIRGDKDLAIKNIVTTVKPRVLQGLNEEESWSLFKSIRELKSSSEVNEDVERMIVMDCGGVPLWIIHAAMFVNNRGAAEPGVKEEFLQELKFRYYDKLPRIQKLCFSFCSLFPREHLINVERSIHLLTAEGFVIKKNNHSADDEIFRGYFNEFVGRSVFKDIEEDERGFVMFCRMQPLMHDLARFVVDHKENITVDPEGERVHEGVLRANFDFSLDVSRGIPDSLFEKAKKLRAILLWKNHTFLPKKMNTSTSTCDKIFKTFKLLRMLDLRDMAIITLPTSIGDMKNLRYLDLSHNNKMEKLPSSITKLSNLQTLKLSQCYLLKELPKDIEELTNLKHLEIDGCLGLTHMPHKLQKLTSLETLSLFVISNDSNNLGGLVELASLDKLRGNLEILHLERSTRSLQAENAMYLKGKKKLHRLILKWDHDDEQKEEDIKDNNTLDCLKPHSELRVLSIVGFKGRNTLSFWLPTIHCLVKLSLSDCPYVKFLPQLDGLLNLRFLDIFRLHNLESIVDYNNVDKVFFPSLEELRISDCPNLKSWWETNEKDTPSFPCLSTLRVSYCPKLISMPLYPGLDEELVVVESSLKPLQATIDSGSKSKPFSKLKNMELSKIKDNSHSPWLKHFISLEKLDILEWNGLERLPEGLNYLTSLERLNIGNCQELDLNLSSTEWEGLKNLRYLTIGEIPKLHSLPKGLENVTSLEELEISNCREMTTLSESIGNLKSLGKLVIIECHKLVALPKGLKNIEGLHTLIILDCTLLLPRCQPHTGDDWSQISHIKNIQVTETAHDI